MSSTSRVLREKDLASVAPIWWREGDAAIPAPAKQIRASGAAAALDTALEQEAYQRGLAEGAATGKQQAAAEVQPVLEKLSQTLGELSSLRTRLRRDAEKDLLKLAIAISRRVLHREVTIDPESIEGLIKVALEKLNTRDLCRIRVHPSHAAYLQNSYSILANAQKVELIADASLRAGDAIFETAHGTLDASIESQLAEIERGFADRLQR